MEARYRYWMHQDAIRSLSDIYDIITLSSCHCRIYTLRSQLNQTVFHAQNEVGYFH